MTNFRHSPEVGQARGGSVAVLPGTRAFFLATWKEDVGADGNRPDAAHDGLQGIGLGKDCWQEGFRVVLLINDANRSGCYPADCAVGLVGGVRQRVEGIFVHQPLERAMRLEVPVQRDRGAVMTAFTASGSQTLGDVPFVDRVQVGKRVEIVGGHRRDSGVAEAGGFHAMQHAVSIGKNDSGVVAGDSYHKQFSCLFTIAVRGICGTP